MTDERPRPQYGEYATPEEVAEARGPVTASEAEVIASPVAGVPTQAEPTSTPPAGPTGAASPGAGPAVPRPRTATAGPSRWDRPLTIAMLALAVVNTITTIPGYLAFRSYLTQAFQAGGYGTIEIPPFADAAGVILLVTDAVIVLAAIAAAGLRMRAGRRALWVPIVAFAIHALVFVIVVSAVVLNTPDFVAIVENPPS